MQKRTFLFLKMGMELGGIETYLIKMIKAMKKQKNRVIFLSLKGTVIADSFKKELLDGYVEIIPIDLFDHGCIRKLHIRFKKGESVLAYAFSIYQYAILEKIKKKYKDAVIDSFYWMPHFAGKNNLIELEFPALFRPLVKKIAKKLIVHLDQNNNIIYVNRSHAEVFEENYHYKVKYTEQKFVRPIPLNIEKYDYELEEQRIQERKRIFRIISVGRFDFPHKAYILGLIRKFGELKKHYPALDLTLIGYGQGEERVRKTIGDLPEEAKSAVHLIGKVQYEKLQHYFKRAHLNIGVASTISDGAVSGLISVPVRHYSEKCEGYGYLPESCPYIVSFKKGEPIEKYIREVIEMSDEEYRERSRSAYHTFADIDPDVYWKQILENHNLDPKKTLPAFFLNFALFRYAFSGILKKKNKK